jgi:hypothetical protein
MSIAFYGARVWINIALIYRLEGVAVQDGL